MIQFDLIQFNVNQFGSVKYEIEYVIKIYTNGDNRIRFNLVEPRAPWDGLNPSDILGLFTD